MKKLRSIKQWKLVFIKGTDYHRLRKVIIFESNILIMEKLAGKQTNWFGIFAYAEWLMKWVTFS